MSDKSKSTENENQPLPHVGGMIHSCNIRRNLFMRNKKLLLGIGIMCCLWCLPKIVHGKENKVSFSLVELKCENMVDPLGIDNVTPHLSWNRIQRIRK